MDFIGFNEYRDCFGIYKIQNKINGKQYIGQTSKSFKKRYWSHLWNLRNNSHHNIKLQKQFNKYGEENFVFQVVEAVKDKSTLNELEKKYIKDFDQIQKGYNIQTGGTDIDLTKYIQSETRKRVGEKNQKRMKGRKLSEETKKRMRESSRHLSPQEKTIESVRNYMKNRVVSDETKKKLSEINTGENSPVTKFTNSDVQNIKTMINSGEQIKKIADMYGVSYGTISAIKHNRQWKHIKPEIINSHDNTVPSSKEKV